MLGIPGLLLFSQVSRLGFTQSLVNSLVRSRKPAVRLLQQETHALAIRDFDKDGFGALSIMAEPPSDDDSLVVEYVLDSRAPLAGALQDDSDGAGAAGMNVAL